ncbi:MAG: hypothetical protein ACTSPH_12285 [Promethearchaeota archaeon]
MSQLIPLKLKIPNSTAKNKPNMVIIVVVGTIKSILFIYAPAVAIEFEISGDNETSGNNLNGEVIATIE